MDALRTPDADTLKNFLEGTSSRGFVPPLQQPDVLLLDEPTITWMQKVYCG
jgi:hypothetical protein